MTYVLKAPTREKLMRVGTANIANVLLKHGFSNVIMQGIYPISTTQQQLVGPAYTLRFIPAREDLSRMSNYSRDDNLHRRAIEECPEGAVLVMDAFGCTRGSSMGDMMAARLKYRGVAGVVTDGGYRDSPAIYAVGLPCFQKHNAPPATPIALHPISLNEPIGCGGVAIYPGDVVVGDGDGVVVIPRALVDQVADAALDACEYEAFAAMHIRQGRSIFGLFPATAESRLEYSRWKAEAKTGATRMNINTGTFKSLEVLVNTTELNDDEWINFPEYGFRQYFLWKNVDTGGTIALLEFQKGGCIPIKHIHASNQFMFCLEGEYEYIDVGFMLKSGCFYMNPKDHPHGPTLAHQFSRLIEIYDGPHYYEKPAYHTDESIGDFVKKENQENRLEQ